MVVSDGDLKVGDQLIWFSPIPLVFAALHCSVSSGEHTFCCFPCF